MEKSRKELSLKEIKQISLQLMDQIHAFCIKNNLRYSLFSGTLLGCVRHRGFIPWDDDIDIAMPREDYNFFVKNFKSDTCFITSPQLNEGHFLSWGKVHDKKTIKFESVESPFNGTGGVDIDIYPCDYIKTKKQGKKLKRKINFLDKQRLISLSAYKGKNIIKKLIISFYKGKSWKLSKKIDTVGQKYNGMSHIFYFRNCAASTADDIYPIELFDNLILSKFENRYYYITSMFDRILTLRYGNYMKLPEESKRKPHHSYKAYYL